MNEIKFNCSHCKQRLACDGQFSGRQIRCPSCQTLNLVPAVLVKPAAWPQKTGMTFVPESWQKSEMKVAPPSPQKTGMTHLPESWRAPSETNPENSL